VQAFLSCANASFMRCRKQQVHFQIRMNSLLKGHRPCSVFVSKIPGDLSGKHWELRLHISCPTEQRGPTDLHVVSSLLHFSSLLTVIYLAISDEMLYFSCTSRLRRRSQ